MRIPGRLVLLLLLLATPASAQQFTGTYTMQAPNGAVLTIALTQAAGGRTTGTLSGNGTVIQLEAKLEEGDLVGQAIMGQITAMFTAELDGATLLVGLIELGTDGTPNLSAAQELQFTRTSRVATAPPAPNPAGPVATAPPPGRSPAPAASGGTPQDQQLRQLLLSSPWCSFSYSQTSGSTHTSHNVFYADGRLAVNTNYEGGTVNPSGGGNTATGSVATQTQGGTMIQWQVQGGQLYLDSGQGMQLAPMTVTRNSNGYPIITADGKEYSQCR
ncbi:MAG: hypothetical protein SGJ01_07570 [Gemmatimonadota bacterium]|nr:hypothetical protein [Gemmatimonadota bacterium]